MTKPPTLHRWALVRPNGTERAAVDAENRIVAKRKLRAIIHKGTLPPGWRVVDLGPVEAKPEATPEPRAFKVGDRVTLGPAWRSYRKEGHDRKLKHGHMGTIVRKRETPMKQGYVRWDGQSDAYDFYNIGTEVILVEPAPQPKAEEGKPEASTGHDAIRAAIAGTTLGSGWKATANRELDAMLSEIATLKAEVERLTRERDDAREEMTENYKNYRAADDRAEAAEAKLDDILALLRVDRIMQDQPEGVSIQQVIQSVLDR